MSSDRFIYLGVDFLASRRPFAYVALDSNRKIVALGQGKLEEVVAYLSGQDGVRIALNGPSQPNQAVGTGEESQPALLPGLPGGTSPRLRQAEVELLQRGIHVPQTPARLNDCPTWMKRGFALYGFLDQLGFCAYPAPGPRQYVETQAEAAFWNLIERQPYPPASLEGRLQRQYILFQQGLPVLDPMDFFEEITPRKLLQGMLPLEKILSPFELNAWMAAQVAWLSDRHPDQVSCLGLLEEGLLLLPNPNPSTK